MGRRVSTSGCLQGADRSVSFKEREIGAGGEMCVNKLSWWNCGLVVFYLSPLLLQGDSWEVLVDWGDNLIWFPWDDCSNLREWPHDGVICLRGPVVPAVHGYCRFRTMTGDCQSLEEDIVKAGYKMCLWTFSLEREWGKSGIASFYTDSSWMICMPVCRVEQESDTK
jgi:hypothetical protein